jgi:PKD repeat protein
VSSVTISWPNGKVPVDELFNITAEIENLADTELLNMGFQIRITGEELNRNFTTVITSISANDKVESTLEAQTIAQQGFYTATAEIDIGNDIFEIDEENNIFSTQFSVHQRPVAVLIANNTNPYVGDNITFYANESQSPVAILEYIFDFDDGTIIKERINNIVKHKFDKQGNYEVSLTVIDIDGIPSYKTFVSIVVMRRPKPIIPPVAKFNINPPTGDVTTDFLFESTGSNSAPGTNLVEFDWSFGDNTTSDFKSPIHRYSDDGSYIITLKVTDSLGKNSEIYQQTLIVFNTGPSIVLSVDKNKVLVGEQITFNASNTFDSDDTLAEPLTRFIWNFGDNSSYSESPIQYPDGEYDKITTHIYSKPGDYTITVVVFDDDGESNQTSVNITVLAVDKDDKSDDSDALVFNQGIIISAIILFCILILIVFLVFYNRRRRRYTQSAYDSSEPGYRGGALDYPYYDEYGKGESGYGPGLEYGASGAGGEEASRKKKPRKGETKGKGKSKRTSRKSLADSIKPVVVDVELPEEKVVDWKDEESAFNHTLSMTDVHVLTNGDLSEASIIGLEDEPDEFEEVSDTEPEEESEIEFEPEFEEEPEETEDVLFEEVFEEELEDIAEDELEELTETKLEPEFDSESEEDTDILVFEFEDEGESVTTELHPTKEDIPPEKKIPHKKGERLIPIPGVGFVTKEELKSAIGDKPDDEYGAEDYYRSGLSPDEIPPAEYGAGTEPTPVSRAQAELDMRCKTCYREIQGKFIKIRRKGLDSDGKQFVPIGPFCSPECAAKFEKQW